MFLKSKCTVLASVKTFVLSLMEEGKEQEDTRAANGAEFHSLINNPLGR